MPKIKYKKKILLPTMLLMYIFSLSLSADIDKTVNNLFASIAKITEDRAKQQIMLGISYTIREDLCGYQNWDPIPHSDRNSIFKNYFPKTCQSVKYKWSQNIHTDKTFLLALKTDIIESSVDIIFKNLDKNNTFTNTKNNIKKIILDKEPIEKLLKHIERNTKIYIENFITDNFVLELSSLTEQTIIDLNTTLNEDASSKKINIDIIDNKLKTLKSDINLIKSNIDLIKEIDKTEIQELINKISSLSFKELNNALTPLKKSTSVELYDEYKKMNNIQKVLFLSIMEDIKTKGIAIHKYISLTEKYSSLINTFKGKNNISSSFMLLYESIREIYKNKYKNKKVDIFEKLNDGGIAKSDFSDMLYKKECERIKSKLKKRYMTYNQFSDICDIYNSNEDINITKENYIIQETNTTEEVYSKYTKTIKTIMMLSSTLDTNDTNETIAILNSYASDIGSREIRYWEEVWSIGSLVGASLGISNNIKGSPDSIMLFIPFGVLRSKGISGTFMLHFIDLGQYISYSNTDEEPKWQDALLPGVSWIAARKRRYPVNFGFDISYYPKSSEADTPANVRGSVFISIDVPIWELN